MSWQSWVDDHLVGTGKVSKGMIIGKQGGIWAKTPGYEISQKEEDAVVKTLFKDPGSAFTNGIHFGGERFVAVKAEAEEIVGRKGEKGIFFIATKQAIVVGEYDAPIVAPDCSVTVAKVAEQLKDVGY